MNNIYIDKDSNTIYIDGRKIEFSSREELEKFVKDCEKHMQEKIEYLIKEGFI